MLLKLFTIAASLLLASNTVWANQDQHDLEMDTMVDPDTNTFTFDAGEDLQRRLSRRKSIRIKLRITNLSVRQPFSPFFVMVHNSRVSLYEFGEEASEPLALLAENGDPQPLVDFFDGKRGVASVDIHDRKAPYSGGESTSIIVTITRKYPLVTIASMGINTNDLFVSLNGVVPYPGEVEFRDGLDAGSEENNELCGSIPGPACANRNTTNVRSGNGEGFVHVHPGFHGVGDLAENRYDWRNPMMRVAFEYA